MLVRQDRFRDIMNQYKQVLGLYRTLLRKGRTLHYTDKGYYFKRIRSEFDKNKHLDKKEEIEKCIEKGQFFLKRNALV